METMRRIPSWWFSDITSRVAPCPVVIACDDGDGDEMELWLTKSKSANVTKANLIQNYAGLEGIIRQFKTKTMTWPEMQMSRAISKRWNRLSLT